LSHLCWATRTKNSYHIVFFFVASDVWRNLFL
jgi:hypothetical protein